MALPGAIQDVARRLPAAAARLAGVPGSGGPLDAAEAEQVAQMLATLEASLREGDRCTNRTADALLSDDSLRIPMLRLVAFAVRTSPSDPPAYLAIANQAVTTCGLLLDDSAPSLQRAKAFVAFARKLLRMDVLKCCSRAFSSAAARLAELAGAGGAGAAADAELAFYAGTVSYPTLPLELFLLAARADVAERLAHAQRQVEEWQQLQQQFAGELAAALCDSHVLEHAARLAVHVQLAESAGRLPQGTAVVPLTLVVRSYVRAVHVLQDQGGAPTHPLAEALSGPCVRHALLSLGVAALCAADGGPSYGLPPELLLRLPLLGPWYEPVTRGAPGKQPLDWNVFLVMLQLREGGNVAAAWAPPRDGCSSAAMLHRVGRFAVMSARSWAEEAGAEAGAGVPQLLLDGDGIMPVALLVLEGLRELGGVEQAAPAADAAALSEANLMAVALLVLASLRELSSVEQAVSVADAAALAQAEVARWRLAVEVATHCLRWAIPSDLEALANLLEVDWRPTTPQWLLASAAPLAVVAALAGGLMPLWERLLRCAGRDPGCAEAALISCIVASPGFHGNFWVLLAYGDPRQGAALVATLGKLLRTLVVPQMQWSLSPGGAVLEPAGNCRIALACALAQYTLKLLSAAVDRLKVAGLADRDGSEASAPQLQLARLASLAACEWLPPLARLTLKGMPTLNRDVSAGLEVLSLTVLSAVTIMTWVPVLSRLCWAGPETAAAAGGPAAGSSAAAAAAAAGWRQLLLRDIGAVEMLGTFCQQLMRMGCWSDVASFSRGMLEGCSWLAVACPSEVQQGVLAAAAEAAAAPGGGGGRGGRGGSGAGGRWRRPGRGGEAGPSRAAAPPPLHAWSPQLFRAMESALRGCPGAEGEALGAVAALLAKQAEQWAAGGGGDCAELARAAGAQLDAESAARALRACSPAAARALLRTCSNPACDNLAGDSEAGLQLRACGRCGAAWYCRRECLACHWRSGHKEACVGRGEATAAAEAGPGQSAA